MHSSIAGASTFYLNHPSLLEVESSFGPLGASPFHLLHGGLRPAAMCFWMEPFAVPTSVPQPSHHSVLSLATKVWSENSPCRLETVSALTSSMRDPAAFTHRVNSAGALDSTFALVKFFFCGALHTLLVSSPSSTSTETPREAYSIGFTGPMEIALALPSLSGLSCETSGSIMSPSEILRRGMNNENTYQELERLLLSLVVQLSSSFAVLAGWLWWPPNRLHHRSRSGGSRL